MRILVCGSRGFGKSYDDYQFMLAWFDSYVYDNAPVEFVQTSGVTIVEGCAPGADRAAEQLALDLYWDLEHHPADWEKHGKAAGFIRNREMLESGVDSVVAFWDGESKGTRHTIDLAKKMGIPTYVVMVHA